MHFALINFGCKHILKPLVGSCWLRTRGRDSHCVIMSSKRILKAPRIPEHQPSTEKETKCPTLQCPVRIFFSSRSVQLFHWSHSAAQHHQKRTNSVTQFRHCCSKQETALGNPDSECEVWNESLLITQRVLPCLPPAFPLPSLQNKDKNNIHLATVSGEPQGKVP